MNSQQSDTFVFVCFYLLKYIQVNVLGFALCGRVSQEGRAAHSPPAACSWKKCSEKVSLVLYQLLQYKTDRQNKTGRNKIKGLRQIGKHDVSPTAAPVRTKQRKKKNTVPGKENDENAQIHKSTISLWRERVLEATITPHPRSQRHTEKDPGHLDLQEYQCLRCT